MTRFISGLQLNRLFFREVLRPILQSQWPRLRYSAGLLGWGSDVLGLDTPRSTDHMWGPRTLLFLSDDDHASHATEIAEHLRHTLPHTFRGHWVHFGKPDAVGVRRGERSATGPVEHMVEVFTPTSFLRRYLQVDAERDLVPADWLAFSEQSLLEVSSGEIFHDGLGQVCRLRERLAYYPHDVWLHKLARAWQDLSDEEAFPGRCHELGDETGRRILVARQVRKAMYLCFLLERRYAPYSKWFGTAFQRLRSGRQIGPTLNAALTASSWPACERHLIAAYEYVARKHNRLGITANQPAKATFYFGRPYRVIWGDRFAEASRDAIRDPQVREHTHTKRH